MTKGHSAFPYFTDHPKSKQWHSLAALKTPPNYTDVLQPPVQQRPPQAPRKGTAHFPQIQGLYFYLTAVVTITHHLGLGKEENSHCHRVLQHKPFTDPILTSPRGRAISAPHFCLLSSGLKFCSCMFRSGWSWQKQLAEDSTISLSWNLKVDF